MNGIKVTYDSQTKRISEPVNSFEGLLIIVQKLFSLGNIETKDLYTFYVDKDHEKIEVASEEDFAQISRYHTEKSPTTAIKLEIQVKNFKDSIFIDKMLDDVKLSESYAVFNNTHFEVSEIRQESQFKETGTQSVYMVESVAVETEKVKTNDSAENTEKINIKDQSVQNVIIKQPDTEEKSTQNDKEDEFIIAADTMYDMKESKIDQEIVSKIDQMLSNRLSLLESNFKKMIENNQNKSICSGIKIENKSKIEESGKFQLIQEQNVEFKNEDRRIEIIPSREDPVFHSLQNNEENVKFFSEFCSRCKYQILKNKYICLICEDYILCSGCETTHLEHPLMKVNIKNITLTTKEELTKHILIVKKEKKPKNLFNFNKIGKFFKNNGAFYITIYPGSTTIFALGSRTKSKYKIHVENSCNKAIESEIIIYPKNNKNFSITPCIVDGLQVNQVKEVELSLEAPVEPGKYEFEIWATMKKDKLISVPIKLEINVVSSDEVEETNCNLLFGQFEEIVKLPKDKKVAIYNLIIGEIIKKDFCETIRILKKYDYDIDAAFNELMEDNEDRGAFSDFN